MKVRTLDQLPARYRAQAERQLKSRGHKWTKREDALLREHYASMTHADLGKLIGRSSNAVRGRCSTLGLTTRPWKHPESVLDRIREHYESRQGEPLDLDDFAVSLGVTPQWVSRQARAMGLTDQGRPFAEERAASVGKRMKRWIAENGHPRGMAGKEHTDETKREIARTSAERWRAMTESERAEQVMKSLKGRAANGTLIHPRPHATWKQGWHTVGGKRCYFRSTWEVNYAHYLEWLKGLGEIAEWEYEPETFWFEEIKRGTRSYTPDFRVTHPDGATEYHEVKGWMDARSKTKIKRMAKYHPDVRLVVIDSDAYRALASDVGSLVPEWE